jgi:hypothetical protein
MALAKPTVGGQLAGLPIQSLVTTAKRVVSQAEREIKRCIAEDIKLFAPKNFDPKKGKPPPPLKPLPEHMPTTPPKALQWMLPEKVALGAAGNPVLYARQMFRPQRYWGPTDEKYAEFPDKVRRFLFLMKLPVLSDEMPLCGWMADTFTDVRDKVFSLPMIEQKARELYVTGLQLGQWQADDAGKLKAVTIAEQHISALVWFTYQAHQLHAKQFPVMATLTVRLDQLPTMVTENEMWMCMRFEFNRLVALLLTSDAYADKCKLEDKGSALRDFRLEDWRSVVFILVSFLLLIAVICSAPLFAAAGNIGVAKNHPRNVLGAAQDDPARAAQARAAIAASAMLDEAEYPLARSLALYRILGIPREEKKENAKKPAVGTTMDVSVGSQTLRAEWNGSEWQQQGAPPVPAETAAQIEEVQEPRAAEEVQDEGAKQRDEGPQVAGAQIEEAEIEGAPQPEGAPEPVDRQ